MYFFLEIIMLLCKNKENILNYIGVVAKAPFLKIGVIL